MSLNSLIYDMAVKELPAIHTLQPFEPWCCEDDFITINTSLVEV